jgi:hypothetical protein
LSVDTKARYVPENQQNHGFGEKKLYPFSELNPGIAG